MAHHAAQFLAALNGLDALLTAVETSPGHGLRKLVDTLREAATAPCSEVVLATLAERAAGVLSDLDDHARVVRLLAAGSHWRQGHPRPLPYSREFDRIEATALSHLGRRAYDSERRTGATLTPEDVLRELTEVSATVAATATSSGSSSH